MADANSVSSGLATLGGSGWDNSGATKYPGGADTAGNKTDVGNVAAGAPDSGAPVKVGGKFNAVRPALADGQRGDMQLDSSGNLGVRLHANIVTSADSVPGGSGARVLSADTTGGLQLETRPFAFNGTGWDRESKAASTSRLASSAATTNPVSAKASAGTVHCIEAMNTTAAVKYLKLYNKASAPVVGTDTPVRTMALQPSNVPTRVTFPFGLYLSAGIAWALTGAAADADTTALAAGDVVGTNIDFN